MNLQSALLTGIAIAAFAWVLAVDAHAQTTTPPSSAQETPVAPDAAQPGDSAMTAPKHPKHRAHRMPAGDSTPEEKAATDRLNEQQLAGTSSASNRTAPPEPNMAGSTPADGPASPANQPSASSPPQ